MVVIPAILYVLFLELPKIVTSQQSPKRASQNESASFTFLNASGDCMLYAKRISFIVYNFTQNLKNGAEVEIYSIPLKNVIQTKADGKCSDYDGNLILNLQSAAAGRYNHKLESLRVKVHFNLSRALNWWYIDEVNVTGLGSIFVNDKGKIDLSYNQTEVRGYIDGPKSFSYACGQQRPFVFYTRPKEAKKGEEQKVEFKYGLNFTNLQIQPFRLNNSNSRGKNWYGFTDDVYDCVPFMSVGVWMFLISASILLCIVLSGIFMLASLKTNDRFDDIKGKPLVVNVKE